MKMERLTSAANPRLKRYRALAGREARRELNLMAAEGFRLVKEALMSPAAVSELFLADDTPEPAKREIMSLAGRASGPDGPQIWELPAALFNRMAHTKSPQGVAAVVAFPAAPSQTEALAWRKGVLLHRPQDPGNLGAIIRSAEAAGWDGLAVIEGGCDAYNPKAVRASMGSVFRLPVWETDRAAMNVLGRAGFRFLAADASAAVSVFEVDMAKPLMFVFGGETSGLPEGIPLHGTFAIPMTGKVDSLNVAAAVTVSLFEAVRRERAGLMDGPASGGCHEQ